MANKRKPLISQEVNSINARRAKQAAMSIVAWRPIRQIFGAVALLVLVRTMDESSFGAYQVYYSIIGLLATGASFGISNTLARYLPEFFNQNKFYLANRIVTTARWLRLASNILVLSVIWLFWNEISSFLNIVEFADSYLIFAAVAIAYFQARVLIVVFASYLMQRTSLILQTLLPAVKVIGYLIAVKLGITVTSVLVADMIAYAVMFFGLRFHYSRHVRSEGGPTAFSKDESRRMIRYGLFYNFNDMGHIPVGNRIDTFFIASIIDAASVGAYALGYRVVEIAGRLMPHKFFLDVIRPLFFTLDRVGDSQGVTMYFQILVKLSYLFMVPATAYAAVAHRDIFDVVFGGRYQEFSSLLVWLFCFASLTAFEKPLTLLMQLHEKAAIILMAKLSGLYNILALLALVPSYGVYGAAVATGSAEMLRQAFQWWFVRHDASFRNMGKFFGLTITGWLIFYALLAWAQNYIGSAIWRLILSTIFGAIWWLGYIRLPLFNLEERSAISRAAGPRSRKVLELIGILKSAT
jgi:O-antigen/teichoic acid export membrane protein